MSFVLICCGYQENVTHWLDFLHSFSAISPGNLFIIYRWLESIAGNVVVLSLVCLFLWIILSLEIDFFFWRLLMVSWQCFRETYLCFRDAYAIGSNVVYVWANVYLSNCFSVQRGIKSVMGCSTLLTLRPTKWKLYLKSSAQVKLNTFDNNQVGICE